MSRDCLIVFVKEPRPGTTKTRLLPAIDAETAAELYRALADEEIRRTAPRPGDYDRLFFFTPAEARPALESWLSGEELVPQDGGDLGARMAAAFAECFRRGARRVAIIGTDVPWVGRDIVTEAFAALDVHDVVLGPTADGGYYLLALDRPRPALFQSIAWSTPAVFPATVERAGTLGLRVRVLAELPDIDTIDDVRAHWPELRPLLAGRPVAERVARALAGARPSG
jgi:rSAM/selenodomain-associated transferase 1